MGRPIIQHQCHRLHLAALGFCNDNRLEKGTEVDKAFARMALAIDQPISHTPGGHQVQCAMASVTWGLIDWMLGHGWTRSLLGLTSLNRGFLIRTDRGQDGPAAGMSWVPGCVARSGTARGGFARR